jgi:hypothetical protein
VPVVAVRNLAIANPDQMVTRPRISAELEHDEVLTGREPVASRENLEFERSATLGKQRVENCGASSGRRRIAR